MLIRKKIQKMLRCKINDISKKHFKHIGTDYICPFFIQHCFFISNISTREHQNPTPHRLNYKNNFYPGAILVYKKYQTSVLNLKKILKYFYPGKNSSFSQSKKRFTQIMNELFDFQISHKYYTKNKHKYQ